VKEIRAANAQPTKSFTSSALPEKSSIDGEAICQVFGQKGDANNGMYKVTVGREVKMPCGCDVGSSMGVNTWAAFAGTPDDALVVGDFAVLEGDLQTVLKTLREAEFIFVPPTGVVEKAKELDAVPYDVHGVELTHDGELCSFDAFLKKYNLDEPELRYLALIVRGADTDRHDLKEEFVLLEHAKPIVIARDDVVLGTSERFVFPGSRRRSTGLGKRNRTAWGGRADRSFFGGCSQSTLIRRCS